MNRKTLLLFAAVLIPAFCWGQSADKEYSLSAADAVELALKNNISVARQQITLDAARRAKSHSWNSLSPSLSLGATATVPLDALTAGDQESKYSSSLSVSASASISLSANLYTSMQGAKLSYEQNLISFEDALRSVEMQVRQAYYTLIYQRENILLQEENLKLAKKQFDNNQAKYNSGRLSEIDALSAEVNYKSKIPVVENARTVWANELESFKQLLGLESKDRIKLTGSLKDIPADKKVELNLNGAKSVTVKNLEKKLEAAKNSVLDKRFSAYAPGLSASFRWGDGNWYTGYDGDAPDAKKTSSLSLSATIPLDGILPWSNRNDAVDTALDNVKDLELQLDKARKDFERSVQGSLRTIATSQESIKYKEASVQLAQKNYDMIYEAYNRGTKDLLVLQNANTTLLNARVSLNQEILNLEKEILNLEYTAGLPLGSTLRHEQEK